MGKQTRSQAQAKARTSPPTAAAADSKPAKKTSPLRRSQSASTAKDVDAADMDLMPSSQQSHQSKAKLSLAPRNTEPGEVWVVGSGDCGQLGFGTDVLEKERPGRLKYFDDKEVVDVVAGGLHNIVITRNGKLYSWGCNDQKALGREGEETEPGPVEGLDHEFIVNVACGDSISVALTATGFVYAWGTFRDNNGIFGFAPGIKVQDRPRKIEDLKNVVHISAGANHVVAVTLDGKAYTWGVGEQGQLGRKIISRHIVDSSLTPRSINFRSSRRVRFHNAFCGAYHTILIGEQGKMMCSFGLNNFGQLGQGDTDEYDNPQAIDVPFSSGVVQVAGGEHHTIALTEKMQVYAFGRGDSGQLGLLDAGTAVSTPTRLESIENVVSISAGGSFCLAIVSENDTNSLYGWGYGEMGQLANDSQDAPEPEKFEIKGRHVIAASAGGQHTIMLLRPKSE
ncbi:hypothetical protein HK105_205825 [Polyrhizophydium stewartii]|uniref:RCC1-like domain-containing protein n=1 Tax=Polyrhizophydium stewartii TaxID=2732419 RepID=A0ABR4N5D0_9FUNG